MIEQNQCDGCKRGLPTMNDAWGKLAHWSKADFTGILDSYCTKDRYVSHPEVPEWELRLNQLAMKAWKGGLWHSESLFIDSMKEFCISLRNKTLEEAAEAVKPKGDSDYSDGDTPGTKLINHREFGIKQGIRIAVTTILSLKTKQNE